MRANENEDDIHKETEDILKKIEEQMKLSNEVLYSQPPRSTRYSVAIPRNRPILNSETQNIVKIKDSSLEFVNIDEDFINKPKDCPFDDICSICSSRIYYEKYLCVICKDCIICPNCELNHLHPVIKWKNNQLCSLNSIFLFLSNYNKDIQKLNSNNKSGFFGSNKTKYEFKLESNSLEYSMKPREKMEIPLNIINLSKMDVDCKKIKLVLFGRNTKDLMINNKEIENKIGRGQALKTTISVESNNFCKNYNFTVGLFSTEDIDIEFNNLNFKLNVFVDNEEEELNLKFKDYPDLIKENKSIKKGVKIIMENDKIKEDTMVILRYLKKNHGNVHETIQNLISKNNNNES